MVLPKTVEIHDILRLSTKQAAEVLERMRPSTASVPKERRLSPRVFYTEVSRLCALLEHERKGKRTYALIPRNLSSTGISLLHGKFVYGGTNCVVGLRALDGQVVPVRGKVIWCRLVAGRMHELGVQCEDPIDVGDFVR